MGDPSNNRFYRESADIPHSGLNGSYRDFDAKTDYDNGYRAAVRLACVLMGKHWPEAKGWFPAPDLLGVITQLDHITAHLQGYLAGPIPEPSVSTPPAADDGAPCTLADRVGTSANTRNRFASDVAAKALYDTWRDQPGWVPWIERGNSTKQEEARRIIRLTSLSGAK